MVRISKLLPVAMLLLAVISACDSPADINYFREERIFPSTIEAPVAFLASEWSGRPRVMASGWLIDGGNGTLFTAKHFTDSISEDTIELGAKECKIFLNKRVYSCIVTKLPPLRDAVVIKILETFNPEEMPKPYRISDTKLKIGETVYIQGFHPHPYDIILSNNADGLKESIIPILGSFYKLRTLDKEVVFDSLEAKVVDLDTHINIGIQGPTPTSEEEFIKKANSYIKVITTRNHKFSFGGLSGGVVIRINAKGEPEAVGIVTAELPERLEYDKWGHFKTGPPVVKIVSDTLMITPIHSVKDLYDYARGLR